MWFGTFGGLSRWDGVNFRTFRPGPEESGLAASVVFALLEEGGGIWIGTDGGGLARFDLATETFSTWRAAPRQTGRLSSDRVLALGGDGRGRVWAGTADGLLNLVDPATGRVERFGTPTPPGSAPAAIRCIVTDGEGRTWAGTEGGGLLEISADGTIQVHTHETGAADSLGADTVRSLLLDTAGRLWIGLGSGGVDLLAGPPGRRGFVHATAAQGRLPDQAVRALAQDGSGTIWVGWAEAGLGALDPMKAAIHLPAASERAMIRAIYRDRSGLMWIGLKDGGLRAYNLGSSAISRVVALADGSPLRGLRGLAELPDGSILAGSDGQGLIRIDPRTGLARAVPGLPEDTNSLKVYAVLVARDGRVWLGTDGAGLICRSAEGRITVYRHDDKNPASLASNVVWCLFEDRDGSLWIGTEAGGLDRLDPASPRRGAGAAFVHHRPDPASANSLRGASVRCISRDSQGRLWVGTWDGGISRLEAGGGAWTGYGPEPGKPESLGDASVNAIFEDSKGRIWVGTGGSGLELLDEELGSFRRFGEAQGLAGSTVYGILEPVPGELWIPTSGGLTRLFVEAGEYLTYGVEDGLADSELSQNSFLAARDGRLWFGGPAGLNTFDPVGLPAKITPPSVVITGIVPHGRAPARRDATGSVVLDWDNAGLSFTIAVTDYVAPARNRYAMRLGVGGGVGRADWTQLGHVNTGYIAPLSPGTWVLSATGANGNGVWNPAGTSLTIKVREPWWGTTWLAVALALSLAGAVATVILLRLRSLHARNALLVKFSRHIESAREDERTNAAREVHDSIGQHLAVLNLQAWWLASHGEAAPAEVAERIGEMRGTLSDAMSAVKRVATNLRPVALDSPAFGETLRWYVRDFGRRTGLATQAEVGPDLPLFSDEAATALFRVLQEALANVARHAGPCTVRVLLYKDGEAVTLEVADDGVGIPPGAAAAADSFGLIGMRERCAALGGSVVLEGGPGRGTRLLASIPGLRVAGEAPRRKGRGGRAAKKKEAT